MQRCSETEWHASMQTDGQTGREAGRHARTHAHRWAVEKAVEVFGTLDTQKGSLGWVEISDNLPLQGRAALCWLVL